MGWATKPPFGPPVTQGNGRPWAGPARSKYLRTQKRTRKEMGWGGDIFGTGSIDLGSRPGPPLRLGQRSAAVDRVVTFDLTWVAPLTMRLRDLRRVIRDGSCAWRTNHAGPLYRRQRGAAAARRRRTRDPPMQVRRRSAWAAVIDARKRRWWAGGRRFSRSRRRHSATSRRVVTSRGRSCMLLLWAAHAKPGRPAPNDDAQAV